MLAVLIALGSAFTLRQSLPGVEPDTVALRAEPLAWQPFYVAGQAAAARRDDRRASSLFLAARRRDPRAIVVRLALLRQAVAAGNVDAAFDEIAAVASLDAPASDAVLARLAATVRNSDDVDQVAGELDRHPTLYLPFLHALIASGRSRAVELHFVARLPRAVIRDQQTGDIVVARLIGAGRYDAAYRVWSVRHPGQPSRGVRDPAFNDPAITPPFGWSLVKGPSGNAERAAGGGLDIVGFGHAHDVLASQTLLLTAGGYDGRLRARGGDDGRDAFVVRLRCVDGGRTLAEAPLAAESRGSEVRLSAVVPARGCAAQSLEIAPGPAEDNAEQRLHVERVTIDPRPAAR